MYIFAYACACVCTSSADRLRSYQPIFLRKLFYSRFFISLQKPIPLLSFVSFNGFNSPFGFFHQPNDARKRANYWPRDTCAISYGATFLPNVPILSSPCSWKRKLPENCRSKSDRGHGKTFLFFFFFSFTFFYLDSRKKKKNKKRIRNERNFSILSKIENRAKENSKVISNVSGEKVRSVGRAVTDFICSTLDGYESCTGIQVSIVYTSLTPRTRNRPPKILKPRHSLTIFCCFDVRLEDPIC